MIYDCFTYCGEDALLKIRMEEFRHLEPLRKFMPVTHVVIESLYTFTGKERKFSFKAGDFADYQVEWFPLNDTPLSDPWQNEWRQRNHIKIALQTLGAQDDDIIIISDVDEVPRAYAVQHYRKEFGLVALQMHMMYYYLNCMAEPSSWNIPKIMTWDYLKDKTPQEVRSSGFNLALVNGGWHFSWQGGVDTILNKLQSFAHQEAGVQAIANREFLQGKIDRRESLWGPNKFSVVNDVDMPYYVQKHMEEFKSMIYVRK